MRLAKLEPQLAAAQRKWERSLDRRNHRTGPWRAAWWLTTPSSSGATDRIPKDKDGKPIAATWRDGEPVFQDGRTGRVASFDGKRFLDAGAVADFDLYRQVHARRVD